MGVNFTAKQAFAIAVREADLGNCDPKLIQVKNEDGFYKLIVQAAFMEYEFYVGCFDGMVYGINAEPIEDMDIEYAYGHEYLAA